MAREGKESTLSGSRTQLALCGCEGQDASHGEPRHALTTCALVYLPGVQGSRQDWSLWVSVFLPLTLLVLNAFPLNSFSGKED